LASVHARYCDRHVTVAAKFRRLISPVFAAGANFLAERTRVWAGEAITE
jgi:hypothetical protein